MNASRSPMLRRAITCALLGAASLVPASCGSDRYDARTPTVGRAPAITPPAADELAVARVIWVDDATEKALDEADAYCRSLSPNLPIHPLPLRIHRELDMLLALERSRPDKQVYVAHAAGRAPEPLQDALIRVASNLRPCAPELAGDLATAADSLPVL